MSLYKQPKSEIIVSGYVKQIINDYIPNDVIYIILIFCDLYCLFDTFDSNGKCIKNKSKMINVHNFTLFFTDNNNKLSDNMDQYFGSLKSTQLLFVSQGLGHHFFTYTSQHKLYGYGANECNQVGIQSISDITIFGQK